MARPPPLHRLDCRPRALGQLYPHGIYCSWVSTAIHTGLYSGREGGRKEGERYRKID